MDYPHNMLSRVYETTECPSVSMSVPLLYSSRGVPLVCCGTGSAIGRAKHEVFVRMCVSLLRYVQYVKVISAFLPRDAMHPRY